jgi:endonuclease YncB( thermonuclease family)
MVLPGVIALSLAMGTGATSADEVYDGDTMEIWGQRTCLYGIDAFELNQTCLNKRGMPWRCGIAAKAALAARIEGGALECLVVEEDEDGCYLSRCIGDDGTDLGAYMVRSGLAVASGDYAVEEADARRRRAGAWEGKFMPPWQWRADAR